MSRYGYTLDRNDVIKGVSPDWLSFAVENDASHLDEVSVVGSLLWDYVDGFETQHLYRVLFDKVRWSRDQLRVPFRCDSPTVRRYMQLEITGAGGGSLSLTGELLRLEERPAVDLLSTTIGRHDGVLRMCSWCRRVDVDGVEWVEAEVAVERLGLFDQPELPTITHGACPACEAGILDSVAEG